MRRHALLANRLALAAATLALLACGKRGDPRPPLRRTPQVVSELQLAQRGSQLEIRIQAPRATTEGERLGVVTLQVLRAEGDAPLGKSSARREEKAAPGERIVITEPLPAAGTLLRVAVVATSNKRSSTQSTTRSLKVAEAVAAPAALSAQMEAEGVQLRFTAPDPMPAWIEPPKPAPVTKGPGGKSGSGDQPTGAWAPGTPPAGPPPAAGEGAAAEAEDAAAPPPLATEPSPPPAPVAAPTPVAAPPPGTAPDAGASPSPEASPAPSPSPPPRVSGFHVYRRTEPGAYGLQPLNPEPLTEAAYLDAAAPLGADVCYEVRTVVSGEPLIESEPAPEACVKVEDKKAPAAPTGVATLSVEAGLEVSWSPSSETDLASYRVYRRARGGAATLVAEVKPPDTSAVDPEAGPGERFQYYVTAVDAAGNESAPSDAAEGVRR